MARIPSNHNEEVVGKRLPLDWRFTLARNPAAVVTTLTRKHFHITIRKYPFDDFHGRFVHFTHFVLCVLSRRLLTYALVTRDKSHGELRNIPD